MSSLPKVQESGGPKDIADIISKLSPLFGSGKTTSSNTSKSSADPDSTAQADELLRKILGDGDSSTIDDMISSIMTNAREAFAPALMSSKAAGVRGYSDSVVKQMAGQAMARATAEAAAAKLTAINNSNKIAAGLVESKLQSTKSTTQTQAQKTGISPAGAGLSLALAGAQIYSKLSPKKKVPASAAAPDTTSLGEGVDMTDSTYGSGITQNFDSGFAADAESQISLDAFGGEGPDVGALLQQVEEGGISGDDATQLLEGGDAGAGGALPGFSSELMEAGQAAGLSTETMQTIGPIATQKAIEAQQVASAGGVTDISQGLEGVDAASEATVEGGEFVGDLPLDIGADVGIEAGVSGGAEVAGSVAAEGIGDFYFPGLFTVANIATEGSLGEAFGQVATEAGEGAADLVGGAEGSYEDIISSGGEAVTDFIDDVFEPIGDIADSACFITTAATNDGDLDNGYSLKNLREFRNTYMQEVPERRAELVDYYLLAPIIVKRINESPDSDAIWTKIREEYLAPAVMHYQFGQPEDTYQNYKDMMTYARRVTGLGA